MTCRCCQSEAREVQKDHARWLARNVTKKDRQSLESYVRLVDALREDIELAEKEAVVPDE